jgi:hypothetical protein
MGYTGNLYGWQLVAVEKGCAALVYTHPQLGERAVAEQLGELVVAGLLVYTNRTGLAQMAGQGQASDRNSQSKNWANPQELQFGPTL